MKERILVVDDSQVARKSIAKVLTNYGFNVFLAESAHEAFGKINQEKPECIFLDLLMPEMDGFEMLVKLKELNINLPVVVYTADIQNTTKEQCLSLGAKSVINKPAEDNEIIGAALNALNSIKDGRC